MNSIIWIPAKMITISLLLSLLVTFTKDMAKLKVAIIKEKRLKGRETMSLWNEGEGNCSDMSVKVSFTKLIFRAANGNLERDYLEELKTTSVCLSLK